MRAVDASRRPLAELPTYSFEGLYGVVRAWASSPSCETPDDSGTDPEPAEIRRPEWPAL